MTSMNARIPTRQTRAGSVLGSAVLLALLLPGCSSPSPETTKAASATPTPTATPTASASATPTATAVAVELEAPQSAEEAIAGAEAAAMTYLDLRAEIETEHPADSSAIDTIATGDVAGTVHRIAAEQAAAGTISTGSYAFEVTERYAGDLTAADGTVYPFGSVSLTGCFITTEMNSTNADGTPAEANPNRRGVARMMVGYIAAEKKWLLLELGATESVNVPC